MESGKGNPHGASLQKWIPLGIIGLVAVCAGLLLPQMLPSSAPPPKPGPDVPSATNAKSSLTYKQPDWPEPPNHQGMFMRLGIGTLVVLGLCVGTIFVCKRWLGGAPAATTGNRQLKLI